MSGLDPGKGSKCDPQDRHPGFISKARPQLKKKKQTMDKLVFFFLFKKINQKLKNKQKK